MARSNQRKFDPELQAHKAWLGLVQPVGLVVAPPALIEAQAFLDKSIVPVQQAFQAVVERPTAVYSDPDPMLLNFTHFAEKVLGWSIDDLVGAPDGAPVPDRLSVPLPDYGETLRPDYAVVDAFTSEGDDLKVLMLVSIVEPGARLDKPSAEAKGSGWHASPQARLERMLRDTETPAGLLCNGAELRLVYAPRGESSGHIGFPVAEMCTVGGRPILAALHMLLGEHRMFGAEDGKRLLDLMAASRKYQSEVSNDLSDQVLEALWELLRGFQAADEAARGRVLYDLARTAPDEIYGGVLTVIMRLVFLLYAEDQGLMPDSEVYTNNYSIGGLYERLREDAGRYPDTMDQRYGAYAWLLATFRLVFDGGGHGGLRLPTRHGQLFNPDEYPFLEGRPPQIARVMGETFEAPRVSDGVIWRVLEDLLVLNGERLSYRALDVEQIGSVYESMMGFDVKTMAGKSIAVRPKHIVINLDELLGQSGAKRKKWLKDHGDCELSGNSAKALKDAESIDDLVVALGRRVSPYTPHPLTSGAFFLQPGEERRRSGSHYTPRELTEPMVRTTLKVLLRNFDVYPKPKQILELKICDPAMGSGAFLIEMCRQLAKILFNSWERYKCMPESHPDEDLLLYARRLIAQHCLYGVDRNPFAVSLAKTSLWLITFSQDLPFTFIDHKLKLGDSLIGFNLQQIEAFHWNAKRLPNDSLFSQTQKLRISNMKKCLFDTSHDLTYQDYESSYLETLHHIKALKHKADLCILAHFKGNSASSRNVKRKEYRSLYIDQTGGDSIEEYIESYGFSSDSNLTFHWEIEFTEVFQDGSNGFDIIIGNPPFLDSERMKSCFPRQREFIRDLYVTAKGNWDIYIPFVERSVELLKHNGTLSLVAPQSLISSDFASKLQEFLLDRRLIEIRSYTGMDIFRSASVEVITITLSNTPTDNESLVRYSDKNDTINVSKSLLKRLPSGYISIPFQSQPTRDVVLSILEKSKLKLKDISNVSDGATTGQAYEIRDGVFNGTADSAYDTNLVKLINTGTVDPYLILWGERDIKYLGFSGLWPVLRKDYLQQVSNQRLKQSESIKVVVAGLSTRIEAVVAEPFWLCGKSAVQILPKSEELCCYAITAVLNSQFINQVYKCFFGMRGMSENSMNIGARQIEQIPVPKLDYMVCTGFSTSESCALVLDKDFSDISNGEKLSLIGKALHFAYKTKIDASKVSYLESTLEQWIEKVFKLG